MKGSNICLAVYIVFVLLLLPVAMSSRSLTGRHSTTKHRASTGTTTTSATAKVRPAQPRHISSSYASEKVRRVKAAKGLETVEVAGSSLPNCSHACGSCSPCRLAMVSFVCASLAEAETCPMAYKCICRSKSFPVP